MTAHPLEGRTVGVTADRRNEEQAELLRARGADVLVGPTMQTVDLAGDPALRAATEALVSEPPEWFVATTGYGVRQWLDAAEAWGLRDDVVAALAGARRVARGAKARSALRQAELAEEWVAPGESMSEVLEYLAGQGCGGARVAVQLFDPDEHPSTAGLRDVAGEVVELPVYRWLLPVDLGPAERLLEATLDGDVHAVTFTSQPALRFLFRIAHQRGGDETVAALRSVFAGTVLPVCIGPVCAEEGVAQGIPPERMVWPEPNRLVPMVRLVAERLSPAAGDR